MGNRKKMLKRKAQHASQFVIFIILIVFIGIEPRTEDDEDKENDDDNVVVDEKSQSLANSLDVNKTE